MLTIVSTKSFVTDSGDVAADAADDTAATADDNGDSDNNVDDRFVNAVLLAFNLFRV